MSKDRLFAKVKNILKQSEATRRFYSNIYKESSRSIVASHKRDADRNRENNVMIYTPNIYTDHCSNIDQIKNKSLKKLSYNLLTTLC